MPGLKKKKKKAYLENQFKQQRISRVWGDVFRLKQEVWWAVLSLVQTGLQGSSPASLQGNVCSLKLLSPASVRLQKLGEKIKK